MPQTVPTVAMTDMSESSGHLSPRAWLFGVGALVVVGDVATKQIAIARWAVEPVELLGGLITLTESRNPGAAFGLATNATPILAIITAVVVVAIVVLSSRVKTTGVAIIVGLFLGGAVGNLNDRLFRSPGFMQGHVVDWIDIGRWPNFNLADSALTTASLLLVLLLLRAEPRGTTPTAPRPGKAT